MGKPRAKPSPPPPPPPAEEPVEKQEESATDAQGEEVFPDDDIPQAEVEEQVELPSPASSSIGGPRMPEPPPFDNSIPPLGSMQSPQQQQASYAPPGSHDPDAYVAPDGTMYREDPPEQPRRDGDPAREASKATAGRETDLLVNAFVFYEDEDHGGQMADCGLLHRITMSRAVMPATYIPEWVGGETFWIHLYYLGVGTQIGRPVCAPFPHRANTGRPFVRGWKVTMDIDQKVNEGVAKVLAQMGIILPQGVGTPGFVPGGLPGVGQQVPAGVFNGQMQTFQQIIDGLNKRVEAAEERARRAEEEQRLRNVVEPLKETVSQLRSEIQQFRNNGGGQGKSDEVIKLVSTVLSDRESREDRAEERRMRIYEMQHGPQAAALNFQMMNSVAELSMKMAMNAAKKDGIDIEKIGDKLMAFQTLQATQRREDIKFKEELIDRREEREEKRKLRAQQLADNEKRVGRNIDAMLEGLVAAIRDREPPEKVAKMIDIFKESAVEFHWADFDKGTTELLRDFTTFPEIPIAGVFAAKAGIVPPVSDKDGTYLLEIGRHLRQLYRLGPFDPALYKQRIQALQQPSQPAAPAAPPSAPAAAPAKPPEAGAAQPAASTPAAPAATTQPAAATPRDPPSTGTASAPAPEAK